MIYIFNYLGLRDQEVWCECHFSLLNGLFTENGVNKRHMESLMNNEMILKYDARLHFVFKTKKMPAVTCVH